jgi:hypothetical protein
MLSFTLPLSIGVGFMIAGLGIALYPPVAAWPAPLICQGTVDTHSNHYFLPGGTSGISRHLDCVTGTGKAAARAEITFAAFGIAAFVYFVAAFVLLQLFVTPRYRRLIDREPGIPGFRDMAGAAAIPERGIDSPAELQAVLGQVSDALRRRAAEAGARPVFPGAAGDADAAERLARLKQLHDAGLIGDDDYEAKKADILSGL